MLLNKKEKRINFTMVFVLMICCISLLVYSSAEKKGWKTYKIGKGSISFPENWKGDVDAGVWWPGKENLGMGRPAISVHIGMTPLMMSRTFEDRAKSHMNAEPKDKKKVTVCGFSGFICTWEFNKHKHMGLYLEEKSGSGMGIMHFIDCQAPVDVYETHQADFENIITSFSCIKQI